MSGDLIDIMHLEVGGLRFSLLPEDIAKHPECFFATLAKREWRQNQEKVVKIDRDGRLFRYVYIFMISGYLLKDTLSVIELEGLCEEADFYHLPDLAEACDVFEPNGNFTTHIEAYKGVRKYCNSHFDSDFVTVDYKVEGSILSNAVDRIPVQNSVYLNQNETPFCITGYLPYEITSGTKLSIYKSSNFYKLNVEELIADATPSPFGHGPHTVFDTNVRNSLEIPASALNQDTMEAVIKTLSPEIH